MKTWKSAARNNWVRWEKETDSVDKLWNKKDYKVELKLIDLLSIYVFVTENEKLCVFNFFDSFV